MLEPDVLEKPVDAGDHEDDLTHYACDCSPEISLCGCNYCPGLVELECNLEDSDLICVVCNELADFPCPRCGDMPSE